MAQGHLYITPPSCRESEVSYSNKRFYAFWNISKYIPYKCFLKKKKKRQECVA